MMWSSHRLIKVRGVCCKENQSKIIILLKYITLLLFNIHLEQPSMSSLSMNKVRGRALNANTQNSNNFSMWMEPISHKQYPVTDVYNSTINAVITSDGTRNKITAQPGLLYNSARLDVSGSVNPTKWTTGQTINTVFLTPDEMAQAERLYTLTDSPHTIASYSYTPKSTNSKIIVEYGAYYDINGFNDDLFESQITVGTTTIAKRVQRFRNELGGGTRSCTIFPISGAITNNALDARIISIKLILTSTDYVQVWRADYAAFMKITEISL
jgi:hypothetical protein